MMRPERLALLTILASCCVSCGLDSVEPRLVSEEPERSPCSPGPGATGAPATIDQAITLINTLPRPVTIPCFVRALDRPLRLNATDSVFSAQPAQGRDRPRIFMESGALIMSVSLGDKGLPLLEFGELDEGGDSIKGELRFPVEAPLEQSAPFATLAYDATLSTCGLCHPQERLVKTIDGHPVYRSRALRPQGYTHVSLEELHALKVSCEVPTSDRCQLLDALFEGQAPVEFSFPEQLSVFF